MTNYEELIGDFGLSKDGKKFIVDSYEGKVGSTHKYRIRFIGTTKNKVVNRSDILNNNVSSKIRKTATDKPKSVSKTITNGRNLRMLCLDCATETTGYAYFENTNLIKHGLWTCSNKNKFKRIRFMANKLEEFIIENNVNFIVLEDTFMKKNKFMAFKTLTTLQGALVDTCERLCKKYHLESAVVWKSDLKMLSGRQDGKDLAIRYAEELVGKKLKEDEAEAICIGIYAMNRLVDWRNV